MARANLNKIPQHQSTYPRGPESASIEIFQTQIYLVKVPLNVNIVKQDLLNKQDRRYSDPKARTVQKSVQKIRPKIPPKNPSKKSVKKIRQKNPSKKSVKKIRQKNPSKKSIKKSDKNKVKTYS
jgi:hypothetical protein